MQVAFFAVPTASTPATSVIAPGETDSSPASFATMLDSAGAAGTPGAGLAPASAAAEGGAQPFSVIPEERSATADLGETEMLVASMLSVVAQTAQLPTPQTPVEDVGVGQASVEDGDASTEPIGGDDLPLEVPIKGDAGPEKTSSEQVPVGNVEGREHPHRREWPGRRLHGQPGTARHWGLSKTIEPGEVPRASPEQGPIQKSATTESATLKIGSGEAASAAPVESRIAAVPGERQQVAPAGAETALMADSDGMAVDSSTPASATGGAPRVQDPGRAAASSRRPLPLEPPLESRVTKPVSSNGEESWLSAEPGALPGAGDGPAGERTEVSWEEADRNRSSATGGAGRVTLPGPHGGPSANDRAERVEDPIFPIRSAVAAEQALPQELRQPTVGEKPSGRALGHGAQRSVVSPAASRGPDFGPEESAQSQSPAWEAGTRSTSRSAVPAVVPATMRGWSVRANIASGGGVTHGVNAAGNPKADNLLAPTNPSLVTTVPTLAQVLVDQRGSVPAQAVIVPANPSPSDGANGGVQKTVTVQPGAPLAMPAAAVTEAAPEVAADVAPTEAERQVARPGEGEVASPLGTRRPVKAGALRENFAVATAPVDRTAVRPDAGVKERNFLSVGNHGVGERTGSVGMRIAEEIQPMVAYAKDLPEGTAPSFEAAVSSALKPRDIAPTGAAAPTPTVASNHAAAAAHAIRETAEAADQLREANRSSVDLTLEAPNSERLRVQLRWQDGVIHTRFLTESSEMRQALAQEWDHAAPRLTERNVKFGDPSFERHDQPGQSGAHGSFSFEQQRQSSRGRTPTTGFGEELGIALGQARGATRTTAVAPASAGPERAISRRTTEQSNLSVWA